MTRRYESFDDFFRDIDSLLARLEQAGQAGPATDIREGLSGLNGLTDGWAYLLSRFDRAAAAYTGDKELLKELKALQAVVSKTVYRR